MDKPTIGIVIVHFHREADLGRLVGELAAQPEIDQQNIVVVNNGGDQDLLDVVRSTYRIRWLDLPNPGYGAAVNAGVHALDNVQHVLVLTHEAQLEGRSILALSAELTAAPLVGLVGPVLIDSRDGTVWSAGGRSSRVRRMPYHGGAGGRSIPAHNIECEWLDGSCFMARRDELLAWGGLDERFFLYFEDVDLGWRVREAHRGVVVVAAAHASQSPGGHLDQFYATRNPLWLFRKHRKPLALVVYTLETLGRLVLGWLKQPASAPARQARRWAGLRQGLSRPES